MKSKIAVVQMMLVDEPKEQPNIKKNLSHALELLEQAAKDGAKAVCFPDYFLTDTPTMDHTPEDIKKWAEPIPGPITNVFSRKAKELGVFVVAGSMLEKGEDGNVYSTSPFIGPDGKLIGKVRKAHPENAPAKYELGCGVKPGLGDYPVFDTEIGRVGIMVDMDGIAAEVPIILGLKGAEIIFWPFNFSVRFMDFMRIVTKFYTFASQNAYIAAAARVGWHNNVPVHDWAFHGEKRQNLFFGGPSGIAFGWSYMAAVPDFSEGIAIATVDTDVIPKLRKLNWEVQPLLRRPETYGILTQKQKPDF